MAIHLLSLLCLALAIAPSRNTPPENQSHFFTLMKRSFSGSSLVSNWDAAGEGSFCNYTGISCNRQGHVRAIDISGWSVSGRVPPDVCAYLPKLHALHLGHNHLHDTFPDSILNCSLLQVLNLSSTGLAGALPDFSSLASLRVLDLSSNRFSGEFPMSVGNLTSLEVMLFDENHRLRRWRLPAEGFPSLKKIRTLILTACRLVGEIPPSIGNMTSLENLQLSGNHLAGEIPRELGRLRKLRMLELYNNRLVGEIPEELGNLTALRNLDMSENRITGRIPESLCRLPNLRALQAYSNRLTGGIPGAIANSTVMKSLSLYRNFLTGGVPRGIGRSSPVVLFELSENQLSGELPAEVCRRGMLLYFIALGNDFSGGIPESYENCPTLLRFRVSNNRLQGSIPGGLLGLPHVSILDFGFNHLSGSIAAAIGNARNLSELFMQNNRISGVLPPEITQATHLVKIDLSNNLLSGPVPSGIGNLRKLNLFLLQNNTLNSSIPKSLSGIKCLNFLDLSSNRLTGSVPDALSDLLPTSINFSNNNLSGPIPLSMARDGQLEGFSNNPGLCLPVYLKTPNPSFPICSHRKRVRVFFLSAVFAVAGVVMFLTHFLWKRTAPTERDGKLPTSFDVKSFHPLSFDQQEIIPAMVEKNVVGHGGSGTVYRIKLSKGEAVAVKKLTGRRTKGWTAEVETLGSIRHKNIVKLYCHFSSADCSLLVYEFMPNGNLSEALHGARVVLNWPTRYQIALGIAHGVSYLHHDLLQPIIHRDIKSTNILLDINHEPKVADFGIAMVLGKESTTPIIGGTCGYLAPEYAYSSKATTMCDVYSYGVVLMELITGKTPLGEEFGESKNIVCWVSSKVETMEGALEVLDKQVAGPFRKEMIQALRIAVRCTCRNPALRPTMAEVVQLLIETTPSRLGSFKSAR